MHQGQFVHARVSRPFADRCPHGNSVELQVLLYRASSHFKSAKGNSVRLIGEEQLAVTHG